MERGVLRAARGLEILIMAEPKPGVVRVAEDLRLWITRVAGAAILLVLLVTRTRWPEQGVFGAALELVGLIMMLMATLGRVWCGPFIAGYKLRQVVTIGPYSCTRHPLYLASFVGAVGLALSTRMLTVAALVAVLLPLAYVPVMGLEERQLRALHGEVFEAYCRRVPRLWPRFSLYQEPDNHLFSPRLFRRSVRDGGGFLLGYVVLEAIGYLQAWEWLPVWFRLH